MDDPGNEGKEGMQARMFEVKEDLSLVRAVSKFLGIDQAKVRKGMSKAQPDFGSLKAWTVKVGLTSQTYFLVSAFAANDPESSQKVLAFVQERIPGEGKLLVGLLNLRSDRGERTRQWEEAIANGFFSSFHRLALVGGHSQAVMRRLKRKVNQELLVIKEQMPQKMMALISPKNHKDVVIVGLGNMGGMGRVVVDYWEEIGQFYDL